MPIAPNTPLPNPNPNPNPNANVDSTGGIDPNSLPIAPDTPLPNPNPNPNANVDSTGGIPNSLPIAQITIQTKSTKSKPNPPVRANGKCTSSQFLETTT